MLRETWIVAATPASVSALRRTVLAFAESHAIAEPPLDAMRLALAEALSNAAMHGVRDGVPGTVTVSLTIDAGVRRAVLVVSDDGPGLGSRTQSPGAGLGLPLMSGVAHSVDIREARGGRGVEVALGFLLP